MVSLCDHIMFETEIGRGSNLNEMFIKSTLPVRESLGMRPPPEFGMAGFIVRYSNTRAPELIPRTIY